MASRVAALVAAAIVAAVDVLYLYVIFGEDEGNEAAIVTFVAASLALAALLAAGGALTNRRDRRGGLLGAAFVFTLVITIVGGLSIGPLLIPALLLIAFAALN